jgi:ATP-dependent DNA helicase RecQ
LRESIDILKKYWGFDFFREKQEEIIESVIKGKDTLALLPTGGGKSLCFQVPAMQMEGVCLVISPLIALMQDQVDNLKKKGINAVAINSNMSKRQIDVALDNAIYGDTKFIYTSPERLKSHLFLARLEKMNINLIAVDEAHCISQWGYDFRPAYINIVELKKIKPNVPFLALTATATPDVVIDIQEKLEFKNPHVFQKSFERDNVSYITLETNNKLNRILEFSKKLKGSGIIYCATRRATKDLCKLLLENGISANYYHGGLDQKQRKTRQADWITNKTKIIVATNAFGMGIDKPDVRFVLHYDIPQSIEAYFQEAGRGGRDLKKARAILFFEPKNLNELKTKVDLKFPPIETIKSIYNAMGNYFQVAFGSGKDESYSFDIAEFSDRYNQDIITVYNSLKFLELGGFILLNENTYQPSTLRILVNNYDLYQYQVKDKTLNLIIQFIVRSYMGVFDNYVKIDDYIISKKLKITQQELDKQLTFLHKNGIIDYTPKFKGSKVIYVTERLPDTHFSINPKFYNNRKKDAEIKLKAMLGFLNNDVCRNQYLLNYFGEEKAKTCGLCNVCLDIDDTNLSNAHYDVIKKEIEKEFYAKDEFEIENFIITHSKYSRQSIIATLRWMSEHDLIYIDRKGKNAFNGNRL